SLTWHLHSPLCLHEHACGFATRSAAGLLILPDRRLKRERAQALASVRGVVGFDQDYSNIDWIHFDSDAPPASVMSFSMLLYPFQFTQPKIDFRETSNGFAI